MADAAIPDSTGLSAEGTSTNAAASVQIFAHRMVRKLPRFWESEFQDTNEG